MISWFVRPVEGINYNFILGMYLFFLAIGAVLVTLDVALGVEALKGLYLIFAPFLPATLWCLVVRRRWLAEAKAAKED
eukprot:CAMPEP_0197394112 /NCGR_PEP_ID=MMETSP1165-20131217/4698_1 /TAXON_ID=284809 /ORGANISM="Chrysocystis fragilis, Strain CCMP3189" /LENGTH=77 /DNA_ID=CAMNT_0042919795 /DNA_START=75 /DNA_END=308 /DNA_ORIENTATION=+